MHVRVCEPAYIDSSGQKGFAEHGEQSNDTEANKFRGETRSRTRYDHDQSVVQTNCDRLKIFNCDYFQFFVDQIQK